jgi:UDP-N-acetylglucosamine 2-epimerase
MIHILIGTKAQLIKMAPLMALMQVRHIPYNFIFTGQHQEKISDICQNFGLKNPAHTLYQGKDITGITQMLTWMLKTLFNGYRNRKTLFNHDKQGIVLIHGDTLSTLLGAIIAKVVGLKVGHVESGLRSFNLFHPFPEEITRLLTFRLSDYFFAPNREAVNNLIGYNGKTIFTEANTLYDALQHFKQTTQLITIDTPDKPFAIATLHRFENIFTAEALERIVSIIEHIARHTKVLFILHKPTEEKLKKFGLYQRLQANSNMELRPRYDYFHFIKLLGNADFIISDGGSNQEECYYLGKPIILLRNATERPDGLGENCLLSHYDTTAIDHFLSTIAAQKHHPPNITVSPSEIILEHCLPFTASREETWNNVSVA